MPTYTYSCKSCGHAFEEFHRMDNRKTPESNPCPNCGALEISQTINKITIGDSVNLGVRKLPTAFKERLSEIKSNSPGSVIKTEFN